MADSVTDSVKSILDYLYPALRYIASGFVAIGTYIYLYGPHLADFKDISWLFVFGPAMIGLLVYGLHFATLDKIFYGWSVMHFIRNNNGFLPDILKKQIEKWESDKGKKVEITDLLNNAKESKRIIKWKDENHRLKRYILFGMANQAYLRSMSKNETVTGIQKEVEKRLALLNFLYCSFYQIFFLTLYFLLTHIHFKSCLSHCYTFKIIVLLLFSGLNVFCAVKFNNRICSREMWLIENFPQKVEDAQAQNKTVTEPIKTPNNQ